MKSTIFITFLILTNITINQLFAQNDTLKTALLIIDVQDFYFKGGRSELVEPEKAALNIQKLMTKFREEKQTIIHIKHKSDKQADINKLVSPAKEELIIEKKEVSCFNGTDLLKTLNNLQIKQLVICGMQTHMCVEAAIRSAYDLGFKCILVEDACATRDLKYKEKIIKAEDVHYSTLATLKNYATVIETETYIKSVKFK